jgi:hypothetical protein
MVDSQQSPLFCPQCGAQTAPGALYCARCGVKLTSGDSLTAKTQKTGRSLKSELAQIRSVGFWVAFFVTLPTLSLPTIIVSLLDPGAMDVDKATSIWNVLVLTAPLTAAIVVMIVAIHYDWFDNGWIFTLFAAALLAATTFLADWLSVGMAVDLGAVWQATGPMNFFEGLMVSYYQLYGFWSFASSIVVGGFIAWIWIDKIMPSLRAK